MERAILKKLLNYTFYITNKDKILKEYFDNELKTLYNVICQAHEEYKSNLNPDWVNELLVKYNPGLSTSARKVLANLLDDVKNEEEPPDKLTQDILQDLFNKEKARQVSAIAIKVLNGDKSISDLQLETTRILSDTTVEEAKNYEEVEFDLDGFLKFTDPQNLYKFRHPGLQERIGGAGPGNFINIFARPECGKTTFCVSETAGYLSQRLRVGYFQNEEPTKRVYLRLICSALQLTEKEIRDSSEKAKAAFKEKYAEYIRMIDCVGMSIEDVDAWAAKNKPNVILLDQLDKFSIDGKFNRDDQRLGELYCYAREIAKRHKALVIGVCQASAEAEGMLALDFSQMAGSKTAKAGEADLIIGIGKNKFGDQDDPYRQFNIVKNKINGYHGFIGATLDAGRAYYDV